jgi:hypothetical protein
MKRHRDQTGSTLLMVIGIVAALAICATTLVALTGNVMSNTATNRVNITAFSVCESAIDTTMLQIANSWPTSAHQYQAWSAQTPSPIPSFVSAMTSKKVEWPSPRPTTLGQPIDVWVYDDDQSGGGYNLDTSPHFDANSNDVVWVVSQACVGDRRARVQVQVRRPRTGISFPRGTDLYCGGNLTDNGANYTDNNLKVSDVSAEPTEDGIILDKNATSGPTAIRAYIKGTLTLGSGTVPPAYDNLSDYPPVVTTPTRTENGLSTWPQDGIQTIFPTSLVQRCVAAAKAQGTYYTTPTPPAGMSGFLVIDLTNGGTVTPPPGTVVSLSSGSGNINSLASPGVILVLGSQPPYGPSPNVTVKMTGSGGTYYGVFYTTGNFTSNAASDSPHIRGAVFVLGDITFAGKDHFYYHDNCIQTLSKEFSLTSKQEPSTWREIKPLP